MLVRVLIRTGPLCHSLFAPNIFSDPGPQLQNSGAMILTRNDRVVFRLNIYSKTILLVTRESTQRVAI